VAAEKTNPSQTFDSFSQGGEEMKEGVRNIVEEKRKGDEVCRELLCNLCSFGTNSRGGSGGGVGDGEKE